MGKNRLDFSKMTEEEFLKVAFEEAARQEIAELEAMDIEIPPPTDANSLVYTKRNASTK